jgi:outer membrane lipoprotein-sorting protein
MRDYQDEDLIRQLGRLAEVAPAVDATQQALDRVRRALHDHPPITQPSRRKIMLKRLAAAALVLLSVGAVFAWLLPAPTPALASLAEVQAALQATRSVTCRQTTKAKGEPDEVIRIQVLGTGVARTDQADGGYTVVDGLKHRSLLVDVKKRQATLLEGVNLPPVNLYEHIRNLPADASARALPGKKLDGKEVLGFVVKVQDQDLTVWADAKTRLPVRIEAEDKNDKEKTSIVIDEFVFDKELDASRFSFEPPAGYKVETRGTATFPDAPADPKLKDLIMTPLEGLGPVKFGMTRADVEKLLGKPDGVEELGKNGFVNLNYGSRGYFLGVSKNLGLVMISCVAQKTMITRVRDFSGKTDKGVALGASTEDIIKAYGKPDSKETNMGSTYLTYNKLQANFTLFSDKLVQMQFMRSRPAK